MNSILTAPVNLFEAFISVLEDSDSLSQTGESMAMHMGEEMQSQASKFMDILQKQNQIKNLLNAFNNHLISVKCAEMQERYCKLYAQPEGSTSYFNVRKIVAKRIRDKNTRWNMKLKSILKSKGISSVFHYFLQYEAATWLESSKVKDKHQLSQLIEFLILFKPNKDFDLIRTYKK